MATLDVSLAFAQCKAAHNSEERDRVLLNLHIYTGKQPWQSFGRYFAPEPGFLTRGWVANGETLWDEALDGGLLNMIATDKIRNHRWAAVGEAPYRAMPLPAAEDRPLPVEAA